MTPGPEPTPSAPPGRRSSRTRRVLLMLIVFAGGAASGAAVATKVMAHRIHHAIQDPHAMAGHIADRLAALLNLTEAQSAQVNQIILRRHDALTDVRREIQPRLETELTTLENEIAAVLTDEQRATWRAHAASMRKQWLPPIPDPADHGEHPGHDGHP